MSELRLIESIIDERYQIIERKGQGSYAEIFAARDLERDELVIIKALNCFLQGTPDHDLEVSLHENFRNEAVALDKVQHPNIIRQLGEGHSIDQNGLQFPYIVLEYMPGGDLLRRCRQQRFSFDEMLHYITQICDALSYAHKCNVIHRDIKPNNLLLSADGKLVKIADFGVAKISPQADEEVTRVGTDIYAPPEHHPLVTTEELVLPKLTPSADIYSLAKTIYTLVSGSAPRQFRHRPITQLPAEVANQQWSEALLAVLRRATDSKIEHRYATVAAFYRDLKEVPALSEDVTLVRARPTGPTKIMPPASSSGPSSRSIDQPANNAAIAAKVINQTPIKLPETPFEPSLKPAAHNQEKPGKIVVEIRQNSPDLAPVAPAATVAPIAKAAPNGKNGVAPTPTKEPEVKAADAKAAETKAPETKAAETKTKTKKPPVKGPKSLWDRADEFVFSYRKTILIIWAFCLFIGLTIWIYSVTYHHYQVNNDPPGSVLQNTEARVVKDVLLRSGPSTSTDIVGWLPRGSKLEIVKQEANNWYLVKVLDEEALKTANVHRGWVYGDYIRARSKSSENGTEDN